MAGRGERCWHTCLRAAPALVSRRDQVARPSRDCRPGRRGRRRPFAPNPAWREVDAVAAGRGYQWPYCLTVGSTAAVRQSSARLIWLAYVHARTHFRPAVYDDVRASFSDFYHWSWPSRAGEACPRVRRGSCNRIVVPASPAGHPPPVRTPGNRARSYPHDPRVKLIAFSMRQLSHGTKRHS